MIRDLMNKWVSQQRKGAQSHLRSKPKPPFIRILIRQGRVCLRGYQRAIQTSSI